MFFLFLPQQPSVQITIVLPVHLTSEHPRQAAGNLHILKNMFEVRVEADFAAAHFLKNYHGKCENLHGHNYKVYAHARGTELDEGGMLLDFGVLKQALRTVCKKVDHTNLNDLTDESGQSVFNQNPSAERIAQWIFNQLQDELVRTTSDAVKATQIAELLYAVDVFETPTSRARFMRN